MYIYVNSFTHGTAFLPRSINKCQHERKQWMSVFIRYRLHLVNNMDAINRLETRKSNHFQISSKLSTYFILSFSKD